MLMNEVTPKLPEELNETLVNYYSSPTPSPEFASRLEARLRKNLERTQKKQYVIKRSFFMTSPRLRPFMAALLSVLFLLALTGVAYAIGVSLGYIPGIGLVKQDAPIRVLAEPVTTSHNGIIFTVTQVVADSDRTTIIYTIDAPEPTPGSLPQPIPGEPTCEYLPDFISHSIRLPDGQILDGGNGEPVIGDDPNLAYFKVIDAPIPQDVNTITVVLGCDQGEATVHLVPALSTEILPVLTSIAAFPEMNGTETSESTAPAAAPAVQDDLGFSLEMQKVVELDEGYLLIGKIHWVNTNLVNVGIASENTTILDANGKPVIFSIDTTDPSFWGLDNENISAGWAFTISGKDHAWPITISIKPYGEFPPVEAGSFQLNLGTDLQVDQPMSIDLYTPVKDAGVIRVESVTLLKGVAPLEDPNSYGLSFAITPTSPRVSLIDKEHSSSVWGGGGGPEGYTTSFLYKSGYIPSGLLNITIMYGYPISSPDLQMTWQP
jgi:hypothetical protein